MADGPKNESAPASIDKILASIPTANPDKRAQMRVNADAKIASGTETQRDRARQVIEALEAQEQLEHGAKFAGLDKLTARERVLRAFTAQPLTDHETKVVQALLDHPGSTSTALSEFMGSKGKIWHQNFGTLCKDRAPYFPPAPRAEKRNAPFYCGILADLKEPENHFSMKPDMVVAFEQLGLRKKV